MFEGRQLPILTSMFEVTSMFKGGCLFPHFLLSQLQFQLPISLLIFQVQLFLLNTSMT